MYELEDIKKIRKRLGITQIELSKKAGVSQSLIAKIESGKIEPTFSNARRIFDVLNSMSDDQLEASEIMTNKILECKKTDSLIDVIELMKKHKISQLPVFDTGNPIGMVSESTILEKISDPKAAISTLKVADIMEDCPPIINPKTPSDIISNLLRIFPVVLVSDKGKIIGLITKSDLLNAVSNVG
jgi:predicted transcriptional regulator